MITFWQQENNKLIHLEQDQLDLGKKTWIDARSVTREDIKVLEEEYHVSVYYSGHLLPHHSV